jgi:uncharacterized protein
MMSLVTFFLKHHVKADIQSKAGRTCLHYAAAAGHAEICKFLLKHGAPLNATRQDGSTALHDAVCNGHAAAVQVLAKA